MCAIVGTSTSTNSTLRLVQLVSHTSRCCKYGFATQEVFIKTIRKEVGVKRFTNYSIDFHIFSQFYRVT